MNRRRFVRLIQDVKGYYSVDEATNLNPDELQYKEILVYESITKVVYYKFVEFLAKENPYHVLGLSEHLERIGYLAPYISENGKLCRFIDGKLVEIG